MSVSEKFYWVLTGIVVLLLVATLIGQYLKHRSQPKEQSEVVLNLNARINAWWLMIAVLFIAFFTGKNSTIVMFSFISFFALREFITLTPTKMADHRALSITFFILIPIQYYLILEPWYGLFIIFLPVYGFLLLPILCVMSGDSERFLERISKIQWGCMISIYCISHVPALLILDIPGYENQNILLLVYLLLVVQISDVFQYVFGKLAGKHKIAPHISPSKTVEGFIYGSISAILVGGMLWWITPFSFAMSVLMSSVIVILGFLGGLVLSAIKRDLGVKDWGMMIAGHGGMMDRMDSVCFAAPIFFHITRYFYT